MNLLFLHGSVPKMSVPVLPVDVLPITLFFRSPNWPGELHAVLANFDGPVDKAPQAHAYWDTHVDWVTVVDELPKKPDPDASAG